MRHFFCAMPAPQVGLSVDGGCQHAITAQGHARDGGGDVLEGCGQAQALVGRQPCFVAIQGLFDSRFHCCDVVPRLCQILVVQMVSALVRSFFLHKPLAVGLQRRTSRHTTRGLAHSFDDERFADGQQHRESVKKVGADCGVIPKHVGW
jgi:hypothetical protein